MAKNEKLKQHRDINFLTGSDKFFYDFKKIIFRYVFENSIFVFENLEQPVKRNGSDANGPRKHDFHEETIPIDTGETDFRSAVTHFLISFVIL